MLRFAIEQLWDLETFRIKGPDSNLSHMLLTDTCTQTALSQLAYVWITLH